MKCNKVLDIGCGNGVFLELLAKSNIAGEGVDINKEAVSVCTKKGLKVFCDDAETCLKDKLNIYDGVYISHVVEHLTSIRFRSYGSC